MAKDIYTVTKTTTDLQEKPDIQAKINRRDSQLLFGEEFEASGREEGGWIYGRSRIDDYEGYIRRENLHPKTREPTHIVDVRLTNIYPEPNFKTRPLMMLSFLSRLAVEVKHEENGFTEVPEYGWIYKDHITAITEPEKPDLLQTALKFTSTPYLYGGRSALGIDCSALVQLSLLRAGVRSPRDSDQQERAFRGKRSEADPQRGDLVFFQDHVGIMAGSNEVLNASARTMSTMIEPLSALIETYGEIISLCRVQSQHVS